MEALLIYYNPNHNSYYRKIVKWWHDHYVGYINQYNHVIVQITVFYDNKLIQVYNYTEFMKLGHTIPKESTKNKIINGAIHLLNKLK